MLGCPWSGGLGFRIVDLEPLGSHHCGFEYCYGLWNPSCEEAIQLRYGMLVSSTLVPEIMHRGKPEVFLHQ